jgi:hypothetical protein
MKAWDKAFAAVTVGFIVAIYTFLVFWWGAYLAGWDVPAFAITGALSGLGTGATASFFTMKKFYHINAALLALIHFACSIGIFGYFMGLPVFNVITGIIAGAYVGRRSGILGEDRAQFNKKLLHANIFSAAVLLAACCVSATLALNDASTPANLKGMLGLAMTTPELWGIIVGGGAVLIGAQWYLATLLARVCFKAVEKRKEAESIYVDK